MVKFSLNHNISILMISLAVLILGSVIFVNSTFDFIPEISNTNITIETNYKNLSAEEVKELITIPLEDAISSLKGLKNLKSTSRNEYSILSLDIDRKFNIEETLQNAKNLVDVAYQSLPQNCTKPKVQITDNSSAPFKLVLKGKENLLQIAEDQVVSNLSRNSAVGKINTSGGKEKEIHIQIDQNQKDKFKLNLESIANLINSQNIEYPAGTISNGNFEYQLITDSLIKSTEELSNLPLSYNDGSLQKISDIGTVKFDYAKKDSFVNYNNEEIVLITVLKKKNISPFKLQKELKNFIKDFNKKQKNYSLKIIENPAEELSLALIFTLLAFCSGILITYFVTKKFYNNKLSFYILLTIPWSVFCGTICLALTNNSINLISLCGITVGLGMVVDCPTVCVNSIIKEKNILIGIQKVQTSNFTSCATTVIVFLPLFFLKGIYKELFSCFAISVIASILSSFLYSITILPALLKNLPESIFVPKKTKLDLISKTFTQFANKKINFKIPIIILSICICTICLLLIKKENIPSSKSKYVNGTIYLQNHINMKTFDPNSIYEIFNQMGFTEILLEGGLENSNTEKLLNPQNKKNQVDFRITIKNKRDFNKIKNCLLQKQIIFTLWPDFNFLQKLLNQNNLTINESNMNYTKFIPSAELCSKFNITPQELARYISIEKDGIYSTEILLNNKKIPVKVINQIEPNFKDIKLYAEENFIELKNFGTFEEVNSNELIYRINKIDYSKNSNSQLKKENNGLIFIYLLSILELFCLLSSILENPKFSFNALLTVLPGVAGSLLFLLIFLQSLNIFTLLSMVILMGTSINNSIILYEGKFNNLATSFESIFITSTTTILGLLPFALDFLNLNNTSSISLSIIGGIIFSTFCTLLIIPGEIN